MRRQILVAALAFAADAVLAQVAPNLPFEQRLKRLEGELRCLVCQNQTLADSNAPLAEDLRREVRALATSGKSDVEIRDFLVARYGDFVLYSPPVKGSTWLLWFGPFALLAVGIGVWFAIVHGRRRSVAAAAASGPAIAPDAAERARALLDETAQQ